MAFWPYLTLGVIAALIILGAVAINNALESRYYAILSDEDREGIRNAIQAALSSPEVKSMLDNSIYNSTSYQRVGDSHRVTVVAGERWTVEPVDGNFTNGYIQSMNEKTAVVYVDESNAVMSVKVETSPVDVVQIRFSENQKKIIMTSLADPRVQELVADKEYYVFQVRESGVGYTGHCVAECALVGFDLVHSPSGALMTVILNPESGEVLLVSAGRGWSE
jgi:hypothetical protein